MKNFSNNNTYFMMSVCEFISTIEYYSPTLQCEEYL
jgi:hypothetical protein